MSKSTIGAFVVAGAMAAVGVGALIGAEGSAVAGRSRTPDDGETDLRGIVRVTSNRSGERQCWGVCAVRDAEGKDLFDGAPVEFPVEAKSMGGADSCIAALRAECVAKIQ